MKLKSTELETASETETTDAEFISDDEKPAQVPTEEVLKKDSAELPEEIDPIHFGIMNKLAPEIPVQPAASEISPEELSTDEPVEVPSVPEPVCDPEIIAEEAAGFCALVGYYLASPDLDSSNVHIIKQLGETLVQLSNCSSDKSGLEIQEELAKVVAPEVLMVMRATMEASINDDGSVQQLPQSLVPFAGRLYKLHSNSKSKLSLEFVQEDPAYPQGAPRLTLTAGLKFTLWNMEWKVTGSKMGKFGIKPIKSLR